MRRAGAAVVWALVMALAPWAGGATSASAEPVQPVSLLRPDGQVAGPCGPGDDDWKVVRWYPSIDHGRVPLRCGRWENRKGWGYRKAVAKGRENVWYAGMTAATLARPARRVQGSARVYLTDWFTYCNPEYRFKVVVETKKAGHAHMQGVITAFQDFR